MLWYSQEIEIRNAIDPVRARSDSHSPRFPDHIFPEDFRPFGSSADVERQRCRNEVSCCLFRQAREGLEPSSKRALTCSPN